MVLFKGDAAIVGMVLKDHNVTGGTKTVALMFVLFPFLAFAAPFLVCDPQANVDHYVITGLPVGLDGSNVAPDSSGAYGFKFDLAATPKASTNNLTVVACNVWGDCSGSVPFVLLRPSQPLNPVNIRFSK